MTDERRKAAEEWVLRRNREHEGARWTDARDAHLDGQEVGEKRERAKSYYELAPLIDLICTESRENHVGQPDADAMLKIPRLIGPSIMVLVDGAKRTGAQREREAVVRWLRGFDRLQVRPLWNRDDVSDAIERGEHLK